MTILGDRIKNLRKKQGLTQDEIAEMLGIKRSNFSAYETGRTIPPSDKLDQLADILKATTDYLLGKTDVNLYDWIPSKEEQKTPAEEQEFVEDSKLSEIPIEKLNEYKLVYKGYELSDEEAEDIIQLLETALKRWKQ